MKIIMFDTARELENYAKSLDKDEILNVFQNNDGQYVLVYFQK